MGESRSGLEAPSDQAVPKALRSLMQYEEFIRRMTERGYACSTVRKNARAPDTKLEEETPYKFLARRSVVHY